MSKDWTRLNNGIALYHQKTSRYWWCRLKVDGEEYKFSTKTVDFDEASKIAYSQAIYAETNPEQSMLFSKSHTVKKVIPKAIADLRDETIKKKIHKQYIDRLENHIMPHFADKLIGRIHSKDLKDYFKLKKLVSQTTINTEKRAFRILFEYAHLNKLIKQSDIPAFPKIAKNKAQQRDYFTAEDLKVLMSNIEAWIEDTKNLKSMALRRNLKYQIYALANSGLRPGDELETIQYKHIFTKNHQYFARITGGKIHTEENYRDIPINDIFLEATKVGLNSLTYEKKFSWYKTDLRESEDFVFRMDNKKTYSSKRFEQYKAWLKKKGIHEFNEDQSLYSFRHTYITKQLLNNELPVAVLASQVGSSIIMIDKYYSKIVSEMKSDEFRNYAENFS